MTATSFAVAPFITSDALFRAVGSAISTALSTCGMVQTADTGQINWSTVTKAGTNTAAGYEIWRFNDSLQSSYPIYFKLEYGQGTGANNFNWWITVGTGSNGAGTITSVSGYGTTVSSRVVPFASTYGYTDTGTYTSYANSADGSGLAVLLWPGISLVPAALIWIERIRNVDGTPSAYGFSWGYAIPTASTQGTALFQQFLFRPAYAQAGTFSYMPGITLGSNLTNRQNGTTIYPSPVLTGDGPPIGAPSQLLVAVTSSDFSGGATFSMNHYGVSRNWVAAGSSTIGGFGFGYWSIGQVFPIYSFAMRTN